MSQHQRTYTISVSEPEPKRSIYGTADVSGRCVDCANPFGMMISVTDSVVCCSDKPAKCAPMTLVTNSSDIPVLYTLSLALIPLLPLPLVVVGRPLKTKFVYIKRNNGSVQHYYLTL